MGGREKKSKENNKERKIDRYNKLSKSETEEKLNVYMIIIAH